MRRFNLKLSGRLAEAADITGRLSTALLMQVEEHNLGKVYNDIDLPLVPVLARMEQAGVQIDTGALASMSTKLEREAAVNSTSSLPSNSATSSSTASRCPSPSSTGKGE